MPLGLPTVSVVVTNHDYGDYLPAALDSVLNNAVPPVEVVVVDDGSTDHSRAVLDAYPQVRKVFLDGRGQTAAMNAGWRVAVGDVTIFLDADDLLAIHAVGLVIQRMTPNVSVAHWPLSEVDRFGAPTGRLHPRTPMPSGSLSGRVRRRGPESYERPPTSGNAWSRSFLDAVLPLPEVEHELGYGSAHADAFLADLAPFHGDVVSFEQPLGSYRVHGRNDFAAMDDAERFQRESWCYEERCRRLAAFLLARGERDLDVDGWRRGSWVDMVAQTFADIDTTLGSDARFILVDEHQLPRLASRRAVSLTSRNGTYHGPPVDDDAAIAEVDLRRTEGVAAVVVAWPAFWWLDHYSGLNDHLHRSWRTLMENDRVKIFVAR